ncbi:MAG: hypothetical protein ACOCZS_00565 [Verrucomicrobiota bacterium]
MLYSLQPLFGGIAIEKAQRVERLSRDFEDPDWSYDTDLTEDGKHFWRQKTKRGIPKDMEIVPAPSKNLPDHKYALQIRTYCDEGTTEAHNQDDLVTPRHSKLDQAFPLTREDRPVLLALVYVPPVEDLEIPWASFGIRVQAQSDKLKESGNKLDIYYPSIWIYQSKDRNRSFLMTRLGDGPTPDQEGPELKKGAGWYTFAIAFDEDGVGYYYYKKGAEIPDRNDCFYATDDFPGDTDPRMDRIDYHFLSVGMQAADGKTPAFLVDDLAFYRQKDND